MGAEHPAAGPGGTAWIGRGPLLHVVLHEPEIPNNTGNIGRTCVALASALHLIEPLGFDVSEKACRRAGLDYWPRLDVRQHASWEAYKGATPSARRWLLTARATRPVFDAAIQPGDHLVFGRESRGLPAGIIEQYPDSVVGLPMVPDERSLNVSTAVSATMYAAIRMFLDRGWVRLDERGAVRPV
ncbi:MAG: tRNA (cytidine(34)-2'-O)-methyltransferase [Phycisphaeraceae bacterium]|nr:MAG: tRNA (cytidine(34)-2'-O)-methyltransferase [Phycisphaeraceae bacterium]